MFLSLTLAILVQFWSRPLWKPQVSIYLFVCLFWLLKTQSRCVLGDLLPWWPFTYTASSSLLLPVRLLQYFMKDSQSVLSLLACTNSDIFAKFDDWQIKGQPSHVPPHQTSSSGGSFFSDIWLNMVMPSLSMFTLFM